MPFASPEQLRDEWVRAGKSLSDLDKPTHYDANMTVYDNFMRYGNPGEIVGGMQGEIYQSAIDGLYNDGLTLADYVNPSTGEHLVGYQDENGNISTRLDSWKDNYKPIYGSSPIHGINIDYRKDENGKEHRFVVFDSNFEGDPEEQLGHGDIGVISSELAETLDWDRFNIIDGNINEGEDLIITRHNQTNWYQEDWAVITAAIAATLVTGGIAGAAAVGMTGSVIVGGAVGGAAGAYAGAATGTALAKGRLDSSAAKAGERAAGPGLATGLVTAGLDQFIAGSQAAQSGITATANTTKILSAGKLAKGLTASAGSVAGALVSGQTDNLLQNALVDAVVAGAERPITAGSIGAIGSYMNTDGDIASALAVGAGIGATKAIDNRTNRITADQEWELDNLVAKAKDNKLVQFKASATEVSPEMGAHLLSNDSLDGAKHLLIPLNASNELKPGADWPGGGEAFQMDMDRIDYLTGLRDGGDGVVTKILKAAATAPGKIMERDAIRQNELDARRSEQEDSQEFIVPEMPEMVYMQPSIYRPSTNTFSGGSGVDREADNVFVAPENGNNQTTEVV